MLSSNRPSPPIPSIPLKALTLTLTLTPTLEPASAPPSHSLCPCPSPSSLATATQTPAGMPRPPPHTHTSLGPRGPPMPALPLPCSWTTSSCSTRTHGITGCWQAGHRPLSHTHIVATTTSSTSNGSSNSSSRSHPLRSPPARPGLAPKAVWACCRSCTSLLRYRMPPPPDPWLPLTRLPLLVLACPWRTRLAGMARYSQAMRPHQGQVAVARVAVAAVAAWVALPRSRRLTWCSSTGCGGAPSSRGAGLRCGGAHACGEGAGALKPLYYTLKP